MKKIVIHLLRLMVFMGLFGTQVFASCKIDTINNKIDNPCFEKTTNKWTGYAQTGKKNTTLTTDDSHSGTHALKIVNSSKQKSGWKYPELVIDNARTITFSGWNKAKNVGKNALNAVYFKVTFSDRSYVSITKPLKFNNYTHDWTYLEYTKTFSKNVVSIRPYVLLYYDKGTVWFDDISVEVHKPIDTTKPIITLTGANPQVIERGNTYTELNAKTDDNSPVVINKRAVNTNKVGTYTVTYNATDDSNNSATTVRRTVKVVDTTKPIITLTGANPQVIERGNTYTELNAKTDDNSPVVIDKSAVNTNRVGTYTVTYNAADDSNNSATTVRRTVKVEDTTTGQNIKTKVYENAEDRKTTGWRVYDQTPAGASISNIYDSSKGNRVIKLSGSKTSNGYILGGYYKNTASWKDKTKKSITWSMKANEYYTIYISVHTKDGHRYVYYTPTSNNKGSDGKYVHHGLGNNSKDNSWHTFTRDLEKDLKDYEPNNSITEVEGFLVRGSISVDDIALIGNESNTAPVANTQDTVKVEKNKPTSIVLAGSDADKDTLTYTITKNPTNGKISATRESVVYTPNHNYLGKDSFTFKVNDGSVDSNEVNISLSIYSMANEEMNATLAKYLSSMRTKVVTNLANAKIYQDGLDKITVDYCNGSGLSAKAEVYCSKVPKMRFSTSDEPENLNAIMPNALKSMLKVYTDANKSKLWVGNILYDMQTLTQNVAIYADENNDTALLKQLLEFAKVPLNEHYIYKPDIYGSKHEKTFPTNIWAFTTKGGRDENILEIAQYFGLLTRVLSACERNGVSTNLTPREEAIISDHIDMFYSYWESYYQGQSKLVSDFVEFIAMDTIQYYDYLRHKHPKNGKITSLKRKYQKILNEIMVKMDSAWSDETIEDSDGNSHDISYFAKNNYEDYGHIKDYAYSIYGFETTREMMFTDASEKTVDLNGTENKDEIKKKGSFAEDISHAKRYVWFFESVNRLGRPFGINISEKHLQGFADLVAYKVIRGTPEKPRFTNYIDGHDGWYRVDYSPSTRGYAPGDFDKYFPSASYNMLGVYNDKIPQASKTWLDNEAEIAMKNDKTSRLGFAGHYVSYYSSIGVSMKNELPGIDSDDDGVEDNIDNFPFDSTKQ